jgi:hypothetical protein
VAADCEAWVPGILTPQSLCQSLPLVCPLQRRAPASPDTWCTPCANKARAWGLWKAPCTKGSGSCLSSQMQSHWGVCAQSPEAASCFLTYFLCLWSVSEKDLDSSIL